MLRCGSCALSRTPVWQVQSLMRLRCLAAPTVELESIYFAALPEPRHLRAPQNNRRNNCRKQSEAGRCTGPDQRCNAIAQICPTGGGVVAGQSGRTIPKGSRVQFKAPGGRLLAAVEPAPHLRRGSNGRRPWARSFARVEWLIYCCVLVLREGFGRHERSALLQDQPCHPRASQLLLFRRISALASTRTGRHK